MLKGTPASSGIGIGKAFVICQTEPVVERRPVACTEEEPARFSWAVQVFSAQIEELAILVEERIGKAEGEILRAQISLINDPELKKEVMQKVEEEKVNLEYGFACVCDRYIDLFSALEDELMQARAADFRDMKNRLLCILTGVCGTDLAKVPPGSILVAEDISPSQTAFLDPARIQGIATRAGAKYSHISIIARALGVPAVVAVEGVLERVDNGVQMVVDGNQGVVLCSPASKELAAYQAQKAEREKEQALLEEYRARPTLTADNIPVQLAANVATRQELKAVCKANADGIGLLRTEFLFMDRSVLPCEEEQLSFYQRVLEQMRGRPVIVRTLDIGGDKAIHSLGPEKEENPFLGLRGLRFSLEHQAHFLTQIRALLRAGACGRLEIMLPVVTTLEELRSAKKLIAQAERELEEQGKPFQKNVSLGVMIETPAAALCAAALAKECGFFSIGTNDLTQYTLAVDRGNPKVAGLYDTGHPAVLRLVACAVEAAQAEGIPVSVCGEAAADPALIPFFLGVGVTELSVSASSVLPVRRFISGLTMEECRQTAGRMLQL